MTCRTNRVPLLDVRLEDPLGAGAVPAEVAGEAPLLVVDHADVRLQIALLGRDELAEVAVEHLRLVVNRIDVNLVFRDYIDL